MIERGKKKTRTSTLGMIVEGYYGKLIQKIKKYINIEGYRWNSLQLTHEVFAKAFQKEGSSPLQLYKDDHKTFGNEIRSYYDGIIKSKHLTPEEKKAALSEMKEMRGIADDQDDQAMIAYFSKRQLDIENCTNDKTFFFRD